VRQHRAGVQNQRRAGTNEKEKGIEGGEGRSEDKKTGERNFRAAGNHTRLGPASATAGGRGARATRQPAPVASLSCGWCTGRHSGELRAGKCEAAACQRRKLMRCGGGAGLGHWRRPRPTLFQRRAAAAAATAAANQPLSSCARGSDQAVVEKL
jgi:hypothetical protein